MWACWVFVCCRVYEIKEGLSSRQRYYSGFYYLLTYLLHASVVRPSSDRNIYVGNYTTVIALRRRKPLTLNWNKIAMSRIELQSLNRETEILIFHVVYLSSLHSEMSILEECWKTADLQWKWFVGGKADNQMNLAESEVPEPTCSCNTWRRSWQQTRATW
jgi:hypothetical protein